MKIEQLNKRIVIQTMKDTKGTGFNTTGWVDYKTVWASINNLFGKEYWSAKACNAENTFNIVIRYSKDLESINTKNYRIKWGDRLFDITSIDNVQYANEILKIRAMEVLK
ncbi:MAG TPA: head-tail adaptor protein [Clostridium sp.]|nr:head-tail adaptor protein [Clostridium sp.]